MIRFQVDLHLIFETKLLQKPKDRGSIEIVLVNCGLLRLWLNQNLPLKSNLVLVLNHQSQEAPQLSQLLLHISIQ